MLHTHTHGASRLANYSRSKPSAKCKKLHGFFWSVLKSLFAGCTHGEGIIERAAAIGWLVSFCDHAIRVLMWYVRVKRRRIAECLNVCACLNFEDWTCLALTLVHCMAKAQGWGADVSNIACSLRIWCLHIICIYLLIIFSSNPIITTTPSPAKWHAI